MWAGLSELMDQFDEPMVILTAEDRILCWNQKAKRQLARAGQGVDEPGKLVHLSHLPPSLRTFHVGASSGESRAFLLVFSANGLRFVSPEFEDVTGIPVVAVLEDRERFLSNVLAADQPALRALLDGAQNGATQEFEFRMQLPDARIGRLRAQFRSAPCSGDGQRLSALFCEMSSSMSSKAPKPRAAKAGTAAETRGPRRRNTEFRRLLDGAVSDWRLGLPGSHFAVAILDFARFRVFHRVFGRAAGEVLLAEAERRLQRLLGAQDSFARMNAGEFALLLRGLPQRESAIAALETIVAELQEPYSRAELQVHFSARAGLAFPANRQCTPESVLRDADAALGQAKRRRVSLFHLPLVPVSTPDHIVSVESDLAQGIERNEFFFEFQPVYNSLNGKIVMIEALLRWSHQRLGVVSPASFISAAEDSGLVLQLDVQGLERLAKQISAWRECMGGGQDVLYSINMSGCHFPAFVQERKILELLASEPLKSARIAFEITESAFMDGDPDTIRHLQRLREAGVEIWLDDFGDGYSSLRYLADFPVDGFKVSGYFVRQATTQPKARAILASLRQLASSLGLGIVAEGVETGEQWEMLTNLGYQSLQGFLYSRALPAGRIPEVWNSAGQLAPTLPPQ